MIVALLCLLYLKFRLKTSSLQLLNKVFAVSDLGFPAPENKIISFHSPGQHGCGRASRSQAPHIIGF